MSRKNNGRRNKSNASVGKRVSSSSVENVRKFNVHTDGLRAFITTINKLGRASHEFTWHDIRKSYFKETQRTLTVEEFNGFFGMKNKTKRELFELPSVKLFLEPLDGTMLCRFRLIVRGLEEFVKHSEAIDHYPPSPTESSSQEASSPEAENIEEDSKCIEIATVEDVKITGPTSDLSKSEICDEIINKLSHQDSLQSSVTDDEGWSSGRDTRSSNSSPPLTLDEKKINEVTETDGKTKRIAAGSDEVDGVVVSTMLHVEEKDQNDVYMPSNHDQHHQIDMHHYPTKAEVDQMTSSIVVTSSLEAAFEAVVKSFENVEHVQNLSEHAKVHSEVSVSPKDLVEEISKNDEAPVKSSPTIRKLIEKFDTPVNFAEVTPKEDKSPTKSIYTKVLEEIDENGKEIGKSLGFAVKEKSKESENNEEENGSSVVFRSTPTYSQAIAEEKEQLAEFVAEQEEKHSTIEKYQNDIGFAVKEQLSMSSLEKEYFEAKMSGPDDLFAELGEADGFTPRPSSDGTNEVFAEKSESNESALTSEGLITVIERNIFEDKEATPQQVREVKKSECSVESDADIPYSLCSEDEAEPITTIEKSMNPEKKVEGEVKQMKTVVVNVELDTKAKREMAVDVNTPLKDRIAALHAAAAGKNAPIAKVDSVDDENIVPVEILSKTEEIETTQLDIEGDEDTTMSPVPVRRRQGRFIRGCCVVM